MTNASLSAGLAAALLLGACTVAPPPPQAEVLAEALPASAKVPVNWKSPADRAAVSTGWVSTFHDKTLTALVSEALANNLDLKIAAAQVALAQQALVVAGSALYPVVGADLSGATTRNSQTDSSFDRTGGTIGASWEVDLWGRISSGRAAAAAQYDAAVQTETFARLSIAALVARGWYSSIAYARNIAVAQTQVADYEQQLGLVKDKFAAGANDMMDVDLAEATLASAKADLVSLQARAQTATRGLEVLLGRYPGNELQARSGFPSLPSAVPSGTPAFLISRRPDVLAAGQQVQAAFYNVQVAQLALLPGFSLMGNAGKLNNDALDVIGLAPNYLQVGATLLQPIFEGGALNANIAAASAAKQAAVASYGQSVLTAFREVETALANERFFRDRLGLLGAEAQDWTDAAELGQKKYAAGEISLQNLLQIEERQFAAEQGQIDAQLGVMLNRIDLYLALGGGL